MLCAKLNFHFCVYDFRFFSFLGKNDPVELAEIFVLKGWISQIASARMIKYTVLSQ